MLDTLDPNIKLLLIFRILYSLYRIPIYNLLNLSLHDWTRSEPIKDIDQYSLIFLLDRPILVNREEDTMATTDPKYCSLDYGLVSFVDAPTFEAYPAPVVAL